MKEVKINPNEIRDKIKELIDEGFKRPITIVTVDYPDKGVIELIYMLNNMETNEDAIIRVEVSRDNPKIDSVADILPGFRRREMEARDLMGVEFEGLQKPPESLGLHRFLLPHDWSEIPPLRKDYIPPARRKR